MIKLQPQTKFYSGVIDNSLIRRSCVKCRKQFQPVHKYIFVCMPCKQWQRESGIQDMHNAEFSRR